MKPEDLAQQNIVGHTAFFYTAASGMVEPAREMMKDNEAMAIVREKNMGLRIDLAASLGHKDMVVYLYGQTKDSMDDEDCSELFIALIQTELYGKH